MGKLISRAARKLRHTRHPRFAIDIALIVSLEVEGHEWSTCLRRLPGKELIKQPFPSAGVARGLDGFVQDSIDIPHIVHRVQLPAFQYDIHAPYTWPRSASTDAGSLMFRAISELGSRSA